LQGEFQLKNNNHNSGVSRRGSLTKIGLGLLAVPTLSSSIFAHTSGNNSGRRKPYRHPAKRKPVDMEKFVEDCIAANKESDPQSAVKEVLAAGVRDHGAMLKAVGEPTQAGLKVFHQSKTLTIFAATWTPLMNLMPHNHLMWANIGIYTGREDNILWRESKDNLQAHDVRCLFAGDVATLAPNAIHSVTNPLERFTGGLHIYGGDFFATERSQWDPETLEKEPSNGDVIREIFRRANERLQKLQLDK
jgi:predicted metal-dependent enzyme (double-stranded beta helix superfamily)